jgi:2-polyprenyl-6-methoxyphenol hydroxylase-like FAD-dependent oxidoreductase
MPTSAASTIETGCAIAGGGPAGMMLGLLLARAGVEVTVLEKHADFLRDFRGDTVHPSTLEVMYELGLLDELLQRPHQKVRELAGRIEGTSVKLADFSRLPGHAPFIALMPQWDLLDFIAEHARALPSFRLRMQAQVTDLIEEGGRITGVRADTPDGALELRAQLVVAADGRHSVIRDKAGLKVHDLGTPIDVLWLRISRRPSDRGQVLGNIDRGRVLVMLERGDYWQCAFVIPKGGLELWQRKGLQALRDAIAAIVPSFADRVAEIADWDHVKLLTVRVDRLRKWYRPGLLCIGDAAHSMSPIGGVGINLAIQDAVATANLLAAPLRRGAPSLRQLARVQRRRELPTRMTQQLQLLVQDNVLGPVIAGREPHVPLVARLLNAWQPLRRIPARLVGLGFRPEHVAAPD